MNSKVKSGARAVADVEEGRILASVEIAAPPRRVFRALTTSADVTAWWGSPEDYRTTGWEADLRPGGKWRSEGISADGKPFFVEGSFVTIDPPRKLVQTWKPAWDGGHETTLTFRLDPIDGGTRLTLSHEGFAGRSESCNGHATGWERVFGWLTTYLTPKDDLRYFLCRLLPPRPSFATDMNAAEAQTMREHVAYWKGLLDAGTVVVFGPVEDPAGTWGLGVVRVPDEATLAKVRDADPAIVSKRGFRYDTLPMLRAVARP